VVEAIPVAAEPPVIIKFGPDGYTMINASTPSDIRTIILPLLSDKTIADVFLDDKTNEVSFVFLDGHRLVLTFNELPGFTVQKTNGKGGWV
jgi:hypothetical protein